MTTPLEAEFHRTMVETYEIAKRHGYPANYFKRMLDEHGGVGAAKRLLAGHEVQTGLMVLWEKRLLHISVEALVFEERFRPLFTAEELAEAYRRLDELHYFDTQDRDPRRSPRRPA